MEDRLYGRERWRTYWDMQMHNRREGAVKVLLDLLINIKVRLYLPGVHAPY